MKPNKTYKKLFKKYYELIDNTFLFIMGDTLYTDRDVTELTNRILLLTVDNILETNPSKPNETNWFTSGKDRLIYFLTQKEESEIFWKEVKKIIEKSINKPTYSKKDHKKVYKTIDIDIKPNKKLREAAKDYKKKLNLGDGKQ